MGVRRQRDGDPQDLTIPLGRFGTLQTSTQQWLGQGGGGSCSQYDCSVRCLVQAVEHRRAAGITVHTRDLAWIATELPHRHPPGEILHLHFRGGNGVSRRMSPWLVPCYAWWKLHGHRWSRAPSSEVQQWPQRVTRSSHSLDTVPIHQPTARKLSGGAGATVWTSPRTLLPDT